MTTPPKNIMVKCPQCERVYIDWYTPAVGGVGSHPEGPSDGPSTVCSKCGYRSYMSDLSDIKGLFQKL